MSLFSRREATSFSGSVFKSPTLSPISWNSFAAVGGISMVYNMLLLALPIYILQVFDRVIITRSVETLIYLSLAVLLALVGHAVLDMVRTRTVVRLGNQVDMSVGDRLLRLSTRQALSSGQTSIQPFQDLHTIRNFVSGNGLTLIFDVPWALIYLLIVFLLHPWLGTAMLIGGILLVGVTILTEKVTGPQVVKSAENLSESYKAADAIIRNAQVVEAMGMQKAMKQRWFNIKGSSLQSTSFAQDQTAKYSAVAKWLRLVLNISMTAFGAYLVITNEITMGTMIAANMLSSRGLAPLEQLVGGLKGIVSSREALGRLDEALEMEGEEQKATSLPRPKGELSVEKVVYAAPNSLQTILKGISLHLPAGTFLGVLGPSAAGKTTLAKMLVGLVKPRDGQIRLDGANVYSWPSDELGQYVGYLPQSIELFDGTVRDNICRFQPDATDEEVIAAAVEAGCHEMIVRLPEGYDTDIGPMGQHLSGGQRQRIGLARAFFRQPQLLVLDEPNASLDGEGEEALVNAMERARLRGATLVVIAHKPSVLAGADKLAVLVEGRVQLFGPAAEVMPKVAPQQPLHRPKIGATSAEGAE